MEDQTQEQPKLLVFDLSLDATAEEVQTTLNAPYERGYYLDSLHSTWTGVGARAVYRLRVRPLATKAESGVTSDVRNETQAVLYIRDHEKMPLSELRNALDGLGFTRSSSWISKKRTEMYKLPPVS